MAQLLLMLFALTTVVIGAICSYTTAQPVVTAVAAYTATVIVVANALFTQQCSTASC